MPEVKYLVDGKQVHYEGLFDIGGLFKVVDDFYRERGYDRLETKNIEEVFADGRQVTIELLPYKKVNDYIKIEHRLYMFFKNMKERVVEIDGVKRKVMHGRIEIWFDANLYTDYQRQWETRVTLYVLRALTDKYIRKGQTGLAEGIARQDCMDVIDLVKSFLNMSRYKFAPKSSTYFIGN